MPSSNIEVAKNRDVLIIPKNNQNGTEKIRLSELKSCYNPLSYVTMFIYGQQGWSPYTYPLNKKAKIKRKKHKNKNGINHSIADLKKHKEQSQVNNIYNASELSVQSANSSDSAANDLHLSI